MTYLWFGIAKSLQNHKELLSTTVSDGMYYEITHNGDKQETYGRYKEMENFVARNDGRCIMKKLNVKTASTQAGKIVPVQLGDAVPPGDDKQFFSRDISGVTPDTRKQMA